MKPINVMVIGPDEFFALKRRDRKKKALRKKVKALIYREGSWDKKRVNRLRELNKEYEKTLRKRGLGCKPANQKPPVKIEEDSQSKATKIATMYGEEI